ncbi:hypothetical protein ABIE26_005344 [Pedobacter africanus]|uniref:Uncharacterized protein n=1 Tax=Pedobacter africanus TaxID=151894 RepID=A0ACC6L4Q3_9SPHI|nr:hypothetical protein [Pedobacter africanus]MDR6786469.1 hypothetical protein [Pedobacter africanus]
MFALYIFYYNALIDSRGSGAWESALFMKKFIQLNIQKIEKGGKDLLYLPLEPERYIPTVFFYNFGPNDENFVELQNAIDALKNPNKKLVSTSSKSVNGQNKGLTKQTENSLVQTEANKDRTGNNNYTSGRELNFNFGKINNGETHTHSFRLSKNVKSATANCGCVTVDTNVKGPNVVLSRFHGIANYKGPFAKSIAVIYEDGTTETLYLKGELL